MFYYISVDPGIKTLRHKFLVSLPVIFFFLLCSYGLFELRDTYRLTHWKNSLTKEENIELLRLTCTELLSKDMRFDDNSASFTYRKSRWKITYEIHLFADTHLIAINVKSIDIFDGGIIDFGMSKRMRNRVLKFMKEKVSR